MDNRTMATRNARREVPMTTAADLSRHRPHSEHGREDEQFVRVLFIEDRADFAEGVRKTLGRCGRGSFEIIRESDLVRAASRVGQDEFDLVLVDVTLASVGREAAIELATDLAHRLPVVLLTGTEALIEAGRDCREQVDHCIEHADIPRKLLQAIRRYRRLGAAVMRPTFCRIEGLTA